MDKITAGQIKAVVDLCTVTEICSKVVAILVSVALIVFQLRKIYQLKIGEKRTKNIVKESINSNEQKNNCKDCHEESVALTHEQ